MIGHRRITARCLRGLALLQMLVVVVAFWVSRVLAQSPEVLQERVDNLTAQVLSLQAIDARTRLTVLESDMTEVKWLGRSVALAVFTQLFALFVRDRRREDKDDE